MFTIKLPHQQIAPNNAFFTAGLEQVRLLRTARALARYVTFVLAFPVFVAASWWLLTVVAYAGSPRAQRWVIYANFTSVEYTLVIPLLFLIPSLMVAMDIYTIS